MKKLIAVFLVIALCFSLVACGDEGNNQSMVENPPQSEQLSYETNKDGYITSCTVTLGGETYSYTCDGDNYLIIEDDCSVITEYAPNEMYYSGMLVKSIYFYEGTAKEFVIKYFSVDENFDAFCERIQIFNLNGDVVVDKTPKQDIEDYFFGLGCNLLNPPLVTEDGEQMVDDNGNYLVDEGAIIIDEPCYQKADMGVIINGKLTSTTHYDTETGNVIYSCIYDPLTYGYVSSRYDRTDYHLTYKEILGLETLTKQWYNPDGSYFEKITDKYEREVISEGDYTSSGTPIN